MILRYKNIIKVAIIVACLFLLSGCTVESKITDEKVNDEHLSHKEVKKILKEVGLELATTEAESPIKKNVEVTPVAYKVNEGIEIFVYQFNSEAKRKNFFPKAIVTDSADPPYYRALSAKNITVVYPTIFFDSDGLEINKNNEVTQVNSSEVYNKLKKAVLKQMVFHGKSFEFSPEGLKEPVIGTFKYSMTGLKEENYPEKIIKKEDFPREIQLEVYGVDKGQEILRQTETVEYKFAEFKEDSRNDDKMKPCGLHHVKLKNIHEDIYIWYNMKNYTATDYIANPQKEALWMAFGEDNPKKAYDKFYPLLVESHAKYFLKWINHWNRKSKEIVIYDKYNGSRYHVYDIKLNPDYPDNLFKPNRNYDFGEY